MVRKSFDFLAAGMVMFFFVSFASADVPHMISYQGKVTKVHGNPLNGTFQMTFSIYPDTSGYPADWTETQPEVVVKHGMFSVLLGSLNPIPASIFDGSTKYLGIQIESDPEMRPLKPMVSVAYAYRAGTADGGGGDDGDWTFRITDTADTTLMTSGAWGIGRYGNILYGNADSTHVNLGVACTTGRSDKDRKYCTVGGGRFNTASEYYATVGGGSRNHAHAEGGTVAGGSQNTASEYYATVGGGIRNTASDYATVGGGGYNTASGWWATVGGGRQNTASGEWYATVAGGGYNTASGGRATVGGGAGNTASGYGATVPGGTGNRALGVASLAAGYEVRISSDGDHTFAFGRDFTTSTPNAVIFHNSVDPIKVGIGTTSPQGALDVSSTTGAFIVPRMTTAQRNALAAINGMIIYNTTTNQFNFYEKDAWVTK